MTNDLQTAAPAARPDAKAIIDPKRIPITWQSPILSLTGYARAARELLLPLHQSGVAIAAESVDRDERLVNEINGAPDLARSWSQMFARHFARGVGVCFHTPKLWQGQDIYEQFRSRHPSLDAHVGYTMFETDRLPRGWAASIEAMDQVMTPSHFAREVMVSSGVSSEKVRVLPHGLDWKLFDRVEGRYEIVDRPGFVFLSVFEWTERKGWDVLLDAWCDAFDARDDVMLLIRASRQDRSAPPVRQQIERHLAKRGRSLHEVARIDLIDSFIPDAEMPALYASADAFVMPTRGEGFGIPFLEAMGTGLPTIGTRWSGQVDFMNDRNSYLIDVESMVGVTPEFTASNPFYESGHRWAQPSRRHTAELMREVFDHRTAAADRGRLARDEVRRDWTNEGVAGSFLNLAIDYFESGLRRSMSSATRSSVVWLAPFREQSGFAEEARQYLLGFDDLGILMRAGPTPTADDGSHLDPATSEVVERCAQAPVAEEFVAIHHTLPAATRGIPTAKKNIVRAMFETDSLPDLWAGRYNHYDEIWVPSAFNAKSFAEAGVDEERLVVVPEALDRRRFEGPLKALDLPGAGTFRFLSVFDWTLRKGWDLLLRAWAEAFVPGDPVTLILKVHSSLGYSTADIENQMRELLAEYGHDLDALADIVLLDWRLDEALMPSLYATADCYVMPTRGEGWGRPFFESMAAGTPVIGTNWSGQTEFMREDNAWLLRPEVRRVRDREARETPIFTGHRWADVSLEELIDVMQRVRVDRDEVAARAERARQQILDHYDRRVVAGAIAEHLGI